jgi:hypothetical protein
VARGEADRAGTRVVKKPAELTGGPHDGLIVYVSLDDAGRPPRWFTLAPPSPATVGPPRTWATPEIPPKVVYELLVERPDRDVRWVYKHKP